MQFSGENNGRCEIRTHGAACAAQRFSKPSPSTTRPIFQNFSLEKIAPTGFEPVYLGNRPKVLGHYTTFPENEQLRMMLSTGFPAKGLRGWEHSGTIRGPFPCRRNALPLSYAPNRSSHAPYLVSYNCLLVSSRKLTKLLELSAQVVLGTRLKWRDSNSQC